MVRLNYAHKLALTMTALIILAATTIGYPMVYRQFAMMEEQFEITGRTLVQQVATSSIKMVFSEDQLSLGNLITSIEAQNNVVSVIVINRDFEVSKTIGTDIDLNVLKQEKFFKEADVFTDANNVSWFSSPINFKGVAGGVAWVGLNKTPLIHNQRVVVTSAFLTVALLVCAIIWLAIRLSATLSKPINDIILAAKAIDSGNFSYRIRNSHRGEFAELKEAFNNMAENLEQKLTVERNFSRFVSSPVASHYMKREDSEITLQGERVEASIIFVDLVNYTGFSEQHSSEIVADVLNFYFSEFSDACHQFHGNVDKFIGDCAMLVFGCPHPDALHQQHALECAIHIRDRVAQLNQIRQQADQPWLDIRIGLAGGTVLAGLLGSSERLNYSVIGEAANLAARLCDKAPRGGILTERNFFNSIKHRNAISSHETQRIHVKGFSHKIDTLVVDELFMTANTGEDNA